MRSRTETARELSALAEIIATKLEEHPDDPSTRETAAKTLRSLGRSVLAMSETADTLEAQYESAMKLAKEATALADEALPGGKKKTN